MGGRRASKFWIVLKTKQASSSDAVANVRRQGFEYFHPQFRRRAVRNVRQVSPLFPHYLIVRVDERKQDWRVLCSTRGVASVLTMTPNVPSRIPNNVVDELRAIVDGSDDGYYYDPEHDHPRFDPGAPVRGLRGLFADKYGTYRGLAGNSAARVRVLFNILSKEAEFEVRADDLEGLSESLAA